MAESSTTWGPVVRPGRTPKPTNRPITRWITERGRTLSGFGYRMVRDTLGTAPSRRVS